MRLLSPKQEPDVLRSFKPDSNSVTPASGETNPITQSVLAFDDNRLASALFGQYGLVIIDADDHEFKPVSYTHLTLPTNREV